MKKIVKFLFYLNFTLLDLFAIFILYKLQVFGTSPDISTDVSGDKISQEVADINRDAEVQPDECGEECRKYIDMKLNEKLSLVTPALQPTKPPATTKKVRSVIYIPIHGPASTQRSDAWIELAGTDFYLNKGDFPGFIEAYFEATIKLVNGNGQAMVRIWDATHSRAVDGSEVSTSSQTSIVVISGKLNLWAGNNLYKVQGKSLTADTTVFESGRIRIVSEN